MLQSAVSLSTPMLYVSPIVEALRGRPRLVFWFATLTQALLWVLVPSLFYAAPPGNVPLVLAVGHEWQLGSVYGPPLAYWFADLAYRLAGGSVVGVYVLAQACIVVPFWAVFALGTRIVGLSHAALAVLLMAGISVFAASTPDFGPAVLASPLTALALLFYWRAFEGDERSWYWLGGVLGLLVLTTYFGVLLLLLLAAFTGATERGRAAGQKMFPYIGLGIALVIALPHIVWLLRSALFAAGDGGSVPSVILWIKQIVSLVSQHAGLLVLVIVGGALAVERGAQVPELVRGPVDPLARLYVYVFALVPAVLATLIASTRHQIDPLGGEAAPVVLTALAVIVLAGDVIRLYRQ